MNNIQHKFTEMNNLCTGCGSCVQTCSKGYIHMKHNEEGFMYPQVDDTSCISCGLCVRSCPGMARNEKHRPQSAYVFVDKNRRELLNCSSGGAFGIIASSVLINNGVVYGAAFDENLVCRHIRIDDVIDLNKLKKSKYVQSDIGDTYTKAKIDLERGKIVLFSGTPCQVGGLKTFLHNDYENLICVDIACHGVPSDMDFEACKFFLNRKYKAKVKKIDFRYKGKGWAHRMAVWVEGKSKPYILQPYFVPYYYLFLHGRNLRRSCYSCEYTGLERIGDITLADCWGIEKILPQLSKEKGVSVVFCNSERGHRLLDRIKEQADMYSVESELLANNNQPFIKPMTLPKNRTQILAEILHNGYRPTKHYISTTENIISVCKVLVPEKMKIALNCIVGVVKK